MKKIALEKDEFFNSVIDPYETQNRLDNKNIIKEELREQLLALIKELKENGSIKYQSVDKETIKKLKSLGYAQ